MFGRNAVGDPAGFVEIAHLDQRAAIFECCTDHLLARHARQESFECCRDAVDVRGVGAEQDRLRQFVVLGLREEVHRHPVGVGVAIADHQDFGRAGNHVDADDAEDPALGRGDVGIAGADDLVYLRNGLRAIGQRRNRLRAADGEYAIDAGQGCRGKYQPVLFARPGSARP
jgi:hypothetical protein